MPKKGAKTPAKKPPVEVLAPLPDRIHGEVSDQPTIIPGFPIKTYTDEEMARDPKMSKIPWLVPLPDDAPPGATSVETMLPPQLWDYLKQRFKLSR